MLLIAVNLTFKQSMLNFAHPGRVGVNIPITIYHFMILTFGLLTFTIRLIT